MSEDTAPTQNAAVGSSKDSTSKKRRKAAIPSPPPKTKVLVVRNKMMQAIHINVVNFETGDQIGHEIPTKGERTFPYHAQGLGPDVEAKKAKGYLSVFEREQ